MHHTKDAAQQWCIIPKNHHTKDASRQRYDALKMLCTKESPHQRCIAPDMHPTQDIILQAVHQNYNAPNMHLRCIAPKVLLASCGYPKYTFLTTIKCEEKKYFKPAFYVFCFGIFTIFFYFSWFFENLNSILWEKKYANFLTLRQTTRSNIFSPRLWVCYGLWKIDQPIKNCSWWSVEAWEYSFFRTLFLPNFNNLGFHLISLL